MFSIVAGFILIDLLASIPVCVIYSYVKSKPIVAQRLVDWIYADAACLILVNRLFIFASILQYQYLAQLNFSGPEFVFAKFLNNHLAANLIL